MRRMKMELLVEQQKYATLFGKMQYQLKCIKFALMSTDYDTSDWVITEHQLIISGNDYVDRWDRTKVANAIKLIYECIIKDDIENYDATFNGITCEMTIKFINYFITRMIRKLGKVGVLTDEQADIIYMNTDNDKPKLVVKKTTTHTNRKVVDLRQSDASTKIDVCKGQLSNIVYALTTLRKTMTHAGHISTKMEQIGKHENLSVSICDKLTEVYADIQLLRSKMTNTIKGDEDEDMQEEQPHIGKRVMREWEPPKPKMTFVRQKLQ